MAIRHNGLAVARYAAKSHFLLVAPSGTVVNAEKTAEAIAKNRCVGSVHVTSGAYGFVVEASRGHEQEVEKLAKSIGKTADVYVLEGHLTYTRKAAKQARAKD